MTISHTEHALNLVNGFTFPDLLLSHKGRTYRYLHVFDDPFYINVSMLSGSCNIFVDNIPEVNPNNSKEQFFLSEKNQTHSYIKIDP